MRRYWPIAVLIGIVTSACSKEIKPKQGPLGAEAGIAAVEKAYADAEPQNWIGDASVGQYVHYRENMQIEFNPVMTLNEFRLELRSAKETPTAYEFVLREDRKSWNFNGDLIDEKHGELAINYEKSTGLQSFALGEVTPSDCDGVDETDDQGYTYDCVRYFNLESKRMRLPPPPAVQERPGCNGLPDCLVDVHHLKFDRVLWRKGTVVRRTTFMREVALNIPNLLYISDSQGIYHSWPVLSDCVREPYLVDGKSLRVTQCRLLLDFK
jgi:hypothetical protein